MASRTPHGDDWIDVLGGVLLPLVSLVWSLLMLCVRLVQWAIGRIRR